MNGLQARNIDLETLYHNVIEVVDKLSEKHVYEVSAVKIFRNLMIPSAREKLDATKPVTSILEADDDLTLSFQELLENLVYVTVYIMPVDDSYVIVVESNNNNYYQSLAQLPCFTEVVVKEENIRDVNGDYIIPVVCHIDHESMEGFTPEFSDEETLNDYLVTDDHYSAIAYVLTEKLLEHNQELDPSLVYDYAKKFIYGKGNFIHTPTITFTDTIESIKPINITTEELDEFSQYYTNVTTIDEDEEN